MIVEFIKSVAPLASIAAAFVAGGFALWGYESARESSKLSTHASQENAKLSANISKSNAELQAALQANVKLAEFRQTWIDKLREDMAEFYAASGVFLSDKGELRNVLEIAARIQLRLKQDDENIQRLQSLIKQLQGAKSPRDHLTHGDNFIELCQLILKTEWDVLKKDLQKLDVFDA